MKILKSYTCDRFVEGGDRAPLLDPSTEAVLAETGTGGLDFRAAIDHARGTGGPELRGMTFAARGDMLAAMALALHAHRDELIDLAMANGGNTRGDAKFDIDGATGTLQHYAEIGRSWGSARVLLDGDAIRLSRSPRLIGRHVQLPLTGVAIHINAFNFPAWGFAEKAAVALLAGMPVITKPATSTALVAARCMEILVERKVLPPGVFSMIAGSVGDLLDHVTSQDVIAFTGSNATGTRIAGRPGFVSAGVRVNVEADSLNAAVLGPDVEPGSPTWDLFVREVARDMTQKAGQKCTAIRRVLVPEGQMDAAQADLIEQVRSVKVGDPREQGVRMGPLATRSQLDDVRAGVARLREVADAVLGDGSRGTLLGVEGDRGFFMAPVLLRAKAGDAAAVHEHEVFGPVATLLAYRDADGAGRAVQRGAGGLVSSVYSDDKAFMGQMLTAIGPFHGRLNFGSAKVAEHSMGPGTVLPSLVHGGPGRAGGGEELGGPRGLALYTQRVAVQGDDPLLASMLGDACRPDAPASPSPGA